MFGTVARHDAGLLLIRIGVAVAIVLIALYPAPADAVGQDDVQVTRNVEYGTDHDEKLLLDVYEPSTVATPSPILILIHGGGWASGDKDRYASFSYALAEAGFLVFDINYSLDLSRSPGYPRQVQDVHTALSWVQEHAAEFHGDPGRLGVAGGSAGGYLAAILGTQANRSGTKAVRAVVSLSGPMDLVALVDDLRQAVRTASGQCAPISCADLRQATQSLRNLLGCEPARCSEQLLRKASPITYVTPASPPFFLANSTAELVPATQASAMATALRSANVPVDLELVPGDEHSVQYVPSIRRSLMAFLTAHVGSGSADTVNAVPNPPRDGQRPGWFRPWVVVAAALFLLALMTAFRRRSAGRARVTPRQRSERPPRAEAGQSAPR